MTDTRAATAPQPSIGLALRSLLTADLQVMLRARQTFVLNLFVPLLILVVTSFAGSQQQGAAASQSRVALLGSAGFEIAMAITFGLIASALMGYSVTIARDREAGVFQRLRVAPVPTWAIMMSRLLVQFAAAVVTTIVVIVVGSIIHHVVFSAGAYLLIFAVAIFGAAMFLGIGQAIAGLIRSTTAVNAVGRVIYVVLILTGVLGSTGVLGHALQTVSNWSPVGALIIVFTGVLDLSSWSWAQTGAVLACAGYLVVFAGVGIRWFQWEAD
ncbi:ABC transporter permease [Gryllotalpicola protaetiae]|uniref:Transport permease protein n=1 Tax=Gryllotalpicola protaetiae TaxID=2419771 RepID=A0A387BV12_9MICO|nr:ABC transporter permease [Gryllotalpicola protaetiae]AYG04799.1 ABC transporter permease [Gryllotalpicola protaetiae]